MRLHFGFSKRISFSSLLKILALLGAGILGYFGFTQNAFADSLTYQPYNYYQDSNTEQWYYPTLSGDSTSYWYTIAQSPSQFYGDHFTQLYQLGTLNLCSSGFANITLSYNLYDVDSQLVSNSDIYTYAKYYNSTDIIQFESLASSYTQSIKLTNVDLSRAFTTTMVMNDFPYHSIQPGLFAGFKTFTYDCVQKDSALIMNNATQNTQNIINNQNENTEAITEAQQETTDAVNDLNDSINDSDTSGATSSADNLFDNTDVSDPIGLTSIITAPIRLLQSLLNGSSCDSLDFTISLVGQLPKQVSLPSGCVLWNLAPGSVVLIYHITIFGLFGYRVLIDMVHFIDSLRDPDHKNEYTLDL